jgi:hypothetical protein
MWLILGLVRWGFYLMNVVGKGCVRRNNEVVVHWANKEIPCHGMGNNRKNSRMNVQDVSLKKRFGI